MKLIEVEYESKFKKLTLYYMYSVIYKLQHGFGSYDRLKTLKFNLLHYLNLAG